MKLKKISIAIFVAWMTGSFSFVRASDDLAKIQEQYLQALQAISEQRNTDAKNLLTTLVENVPQHAGALMELAIIQCDLGNQAEAERLFKLMVDRFSPPTPILDIIASYRSKGCKYVKPKARWSLTVEGGIDTNVNQGASNQNFAIGSGDSRINLQLLPEYLPKEDKFASIAADYTESISENNAIAFAQIRLRQFESLKKFDTNSVAIGVESPRKWGDWELRSTGILSALTLDDKLYQKQYNGQIRLSAPLKFFSNTQLSLSGSVARSEYPTLLNYDGTIWELRGILTKQAANYQLQVAASALADIGNDFRIGGNRHGGSIGAQYQHKLSERFATDLSWQRQRWQSAKIYSPGTVDIIRSQDTEIFRIAVGMLLKDRQKLLLEARRTLNRENISLFDYSSSAVQLSWQTQW